MSSTESSGAQAEATATTSAPAAALPSFGSTRGSGLARGKRPSAGPAASGSAVATEYTPTAIAVVTAPREYQNPFAPVETPAAASPGPVTAPVATKPVAAVVEYTAPSAVIETKSEPVQAPASAENDEQAELNILPPEQPKTVPAQTWESEGFRPAREQRSEQRNDRPRRDEARREEPSRDERTERAPREESAPFDPSTIPAKFLYVRPGYNYVPTPSNYGSAPRDRSSGPAAAPQSREAPAAQAPEKSGGFLGWLKSLFGGPAASPAPLEARPSEQRNGGDRHRGGHGRSQGGGDGQRRRNRGGRGRSQSRGEYRGGGDQGGDRGGSSGGASAT